ncbi:unnamed protein product [Blepharisma stoltei]|uniref:Uncharacterized protein n=1 Tax=Blepharisma stoltei TaxID=1481888 RepID=A0AAU9J518_9CILI|nr:unnamed protein product [Blepharisma stoltei]
MFKQLNGALMAYDVNNRNSFEDTQKWIKIIEDNAPKDTAIILVANKYDQPITVSERDGKSLADFYKINLILACAKMGDNVEALLKKW